MTSAAQGCGHCYFKKQRFVGPRGKPDSPIAFVGEAPGADELAKGVPFIGMSGRLFDDCLPGGYSSWDFFITNALQCLPIKLTNQTVRNTNNLKHACQRCRARLIEELSEHPREVIVAMGNAALWATTGNYDLKITQERGKVFESPLAKKGIVAAVHPAFLLRGGSHLGKFKEDLEYAIRLANGGKLKAPTPHTWELVTDIKQLADVIDEFKAYHCKTGDNVIGADIETGGFNHRQDEILCLGISLDPRKVYIIPEEHIELTKYLFYELPEFEWVWHNGKFDAKFFRYVDLPCRVDHDTMLMSYAMNERPGFHDLEQVAADELGAEDYKYMIKPHLKNKNSSYRDIPRPILYEYAAYDVTYTKQIHPRLYNRIQADPKASDLYHNLLMPASQLLTEVEETGIKIDPQRVHENEASYMEKMEEPKAQLNDIAQSVGLPGINPNSPKQVATLLYQKLQLRGKHTGSGSTGKDILERLPPHPAVQSMIEYRKLAKEYSTYVKPLFIGTQGKPPHVHPDDGRVHPTFKLHGTATGRLASSEPNMQNIPRNAQIRGQYVADEGYVLIEVDLDQAELRCLAVLSGDDELCRIYNTPGLSIHKEVSKDLWGEDWPANYAKGKHDPNDPDFVVAYEQYMRTKAVNFGIVYGREAPSIAEEFNTPMSEAQAMIDGWSKKFPTAWDYIENCRRAPLKRQNLVTPFGRRKRHGVVSRDILKDLQNQASNFPPQSIASDITLKSAVLVYPLLKPLGVRIVNLIHDAILFEVPKNPATIKRVVTTTGYYMQEVPKERGLLKVPFVSDAKVGYRWGNLNEYEPETVAA